MARLTRVKKRAKHDDGNRYQMQGYSLDNRFLSFKVDKSKFKNLTSLILTARKMGFKVVYRVCKRKADGFIIVNERLF